MASGDRSPREAANRFAEPLAALLSSWFTDVGAGRLPWIAGTKQPGDNAFQLEPHPIADNIFLDVSVGYSVVALPDSEGGVVAPTPFMPASASWRTELTSYIYEVSATDEDTPGASRLIAWHWHPQLNTDNPVPYPHIHTARTKNPTIGLSTGRWHVPSGHVSLSEVLGFIAAEILGIRWSTGSLPDPTSK